MAKKTTDAFVRWIKEIWVTRQYNNALYSDHIGELTEWTGNEDRIPTGGKRGYDTGGYISQVSFVFHPSLLRRTLGRGPKPVIKFATISYDSWSGEVTLSILNDVGAGREPQELDFDTLDSLEAEVTVEDGETVVRWEDDPRRYGVSDGPYPSPIADAFDLLTSTWEMG